MSLGRYLLGVAALLCVLGSVGVGAAAVRRQVLPDWRGAHARLAEIVAGCALLVGIMARAVEAGTLSMLVGQSDPNRHCSRLAPNNV